MRRPQPREARDARSRGVVLSAAVRLGSCLHFAVRGLPGGWVRASWKLEAARVEMYRGLDDDFQALVVHSLRTGLRLFSTRSARKASWASAGTSSAANP